MKKLLGTIILIMVLNVPAWAEKIQPHITVYGTAAEEVTPDEMVWALKITHRGPGIEDLAAQHNTAVSGVLSIISKTGIPKDDTQTSMMQFGENWGHQNGHRVQEGYFASSHVTFKLTDFSKYQQLWTGLSTIKEMSLQNISYGYSKRREAQDKARGDALRAAGEKARAMAATLNVGLGNPIVIEDEPSFAAPLRSTMLMSAEADHLPGPQDSGGVALGKMRIRSSVKVVYQLRELD